MIMKGLLAGYRWIFVALIGLGIGCGGGQGVVTVQLTEQETSGQAGTATLSPKGAQMEIVVKVVPGPPANDPQPLHIHFGTCGPELGNRHFNLTDVVAGESVTLIDTKLVTLVQVVNAINLHKSYPKFDIYTACGNIPARD